LQPYRFVVWKNASQFYRDLERFRQTLWAWLIITTFLLLILMYLVTKWSLRPLQKLGAEVKAIETRKQSGFQSAYPDEIRPLTENLNILLNREQHQRQRYRNAMDDLAHSLKTPLAVLKGLSPGSDIKQSEAGTLREQVDRMNQIVSYQLQKTTGASAGEILSRRDLVPIINKLLSALEKVYQDKAIKVEIDLGDQLLVRIDDGDCMEIIGNLLDNAFKYGKSNIRVSSHLTDQAKVAIGIEDDGPGLKPHEIEKILFRGTRLDEVSEGQGIGLAVVADIVKSYDIGMSFGESRFGGLNVALEFKLS
ncbi:MAG: two-component sensor histidine kinase, partial [Gammaproteobacteria bacterium]|nr:two-component sensor histidine kinase [Gammaproteobacteria bacterium]